MKVVVLLAILASVILTVNSTPPVTSCQFTETTSPFKLYYVEPPAGQDVWHPDANNGQGLLILTYKLVIAPGASEVPDLSHWMLHTDYCDNVQIAWVQYRPDGQSAWTTYNGAAWHTSKIDKPLYGFAGWKMDLGQPKGTTYFWQIAFTKNLALGLTATYGMKARSQTTGDCFISTTPIMGPTCTEIDPPHALLVVPPTAQCVSSGGLRVQLNVQDVNNVQSYKWSTSFPLASFFPSDDIPNPTLIVGAQKLCLKLITVTLTLTGEFNTLEVLTGTIQIDDDTPPKLDVIFDPFVYAECGDIPDPPVGKAFDFCEGPVDVSLVPSDPVDGSMNYTWIATDSCGNVANTTQVVKIMDTIPPELEGVDETPMTVECGGYPEECPVKFWDQCDPHPELTFTEIKVNELCNYSYDIVRTWTVKDSQNLTTTKTQTIHVRDSNKPKFLYSSTDVAEITVQCDEIPGVAHVLASDECSGVTYVQFTEERTDGSCDNQFTLTRTWTATDDCGRTNELVQVINVIDTKPPKVDNPPTNLDITDINQVVDACKLTALDSCNNTVFATRTTTRIDGDCPNHYTLQTTWGVSDVCGNMVGDTQVVTVTDLTPPTISGYGNDLTVECEQDIPEYTVTAFDDFDGTVPVTYTSTKIDEVDNGFGGLCSYTLVRTWRAEDSCHNVDEKVQRVHVVDTQAPQLINPPASATFKCNRNLPPVPQVSAEDNCLGIFLATYSEVVQYTNTRGAACLDEYKVTRHWHANDLCGNKVDHDQVITIIDKEAPQFCDTCADVDDGSCDAVPTPIQRIAKDNCDETVELTPINMNPNPVHLEGPQKCADSYVEVRTWTATDRCGYTNTATQLVTITDTTNPYFDQSPLPQNQNVLCSSIPAAATLTASDSCVGATVAFSETTEPSTGCADAYVIVREWIATDDCGNSVNHVQRLQLYDNVAPVINFPGGAPPLEDTVEACGTLAATPEPYGTDNCDTTIRDKVQLSEVFTGKDDSCPQDYVITRTWTLTDRCGIKATAYTAVIRVRDRTPPTFVALPVATRDLNCNELLQVEVLQAQDCGAILPPTAVTHVETVAPGECPNSKYVTITWTAKDCMDLTYTATQTVHVIDPINPTIHNIPAAASIGCDRVFPAASPYGLDSCNGEVITRPVDGSTPPTLINGVPFELSNLPQQPQRAQVQITPNLATTGPVAASCPNIETYTRTWTVTDPCGLTAQGSQVLTVEDRSPPVFTGTLPTTRLEYNCAPPDAPTLSATDDCDTNVAIAFTETKTTDNCVHDFVLERVYTATDDCGKSTQFTYEVIVKDRSPPTWSALTDPAPYECTPAPPPTPVPDDDCTNDNDIQVTYTELLIPGDARYDYQVKRTWIATDRCGKPTSLEQLITVQDTIPPVITLPPEGEYDCNTPIRTPEQDTPQKDDSCDPTDGTLTYVDTKIEECGGEFRIERTWTLTDHSGLTDVETHTIHYRDTTRPTWDLPLPADIIEEWNGANTQFIEPTASDDCGIATVTCTIVYEEYPCARKWTIVRLCTAMDECSWNTENSFTHNEIIRDTRAPQLQGVPSDITTECTEPAWPTVTSSEPLYPVYRTQTREYNYGCNDHYDLVRTWTVTDDCTNQDTKTQRIEVKDTQPPQFTIPATKTIECNSNLVANLAYDSISPIDACDQASVQWDCTRTIPWLDAGASRCDFTDFSFVNLYDAWDLCGNHLTHTQTVTVEDTQNPYFGIDFPADSTPVEEDFLPHVPNQNPSHYDDCDTCTDLTVTSSREDGYCEHDYTMVYHYTVTDAEGHSTTQTQRTKIQETSTPSMFNFNENWDAIGLPQSILEPQQWDTVSLDQPDLWCYDYTQSKTPENEQLYGYDGFYLATKTQTIVQGSYEHADTIYRTWNCTDDCGHYTDLQIVIYLRDFVNNMCLSESRVCECSDQDCIHNVDEFEAKLIKSINDNAEKEGSASSWAPGPIKSTNLTMTNGHACIHYYMLNYTYIITDGDGIPCESFLEITVQDTMKPTLSDYPIPTNELCDTNPTLPTLTAFDNCDMGRASGYSKTVPVVTTDTIQENAADPTKKTTDDRYDMIRHYSATDACGLEETWDKTIHVYDDVPPTWTQQTLIDVANFPKQWSCEDYYSSYEDLTFSATDNCDDSLVIEDNKVTGNECGSRYTIVYTPFTEDRTGNPVANVNGQPLSVTITVIDNTGPTFYVASDSSLPLPESTSVYCGEIPEQPILNAWDSCDGDMGEATMGTEQTVYAPNANQDCDEYMLTRSYSAYDNCMNPGTYSYTLTVYDNVAPTFTELGTEHKQCYEYAPWLLVSDATIHASINADDACSENVVVTHSDSTNALDDDNCAWDVLRTFTVSDSCGNSDSFTQKIEFRDEEAPVFTYVPDDTRVHCSIPSTIHDSDFPTATDGCTTFLYWYQGTDATPITETHVDSAGCANSFTRTYTFQACDNCQCTEATQKVVVYDNGAPTVIAPPNKSVTCNIPNTADQPTISDDCEVASVTPSNTGTAHMACPTQGYIDYTWTAADPCGNPASATQRVTVTDGIAPTFSPPSLGGDYYKKCNEVSAFIAGLPEVTATDNCNGVSTTVTKTGPTRTDGRCTDEYTLTITWSTADSCNNPNTMTMTIHVTDDVAPTAPNLPDIENECTVPPATPVPTDNCDSDVFISAPVDVNARGTCDYAFQRKWTLTDNCGANGYVFQNVKITDNTAPVFNGPEPTAITNVPCHLIPETINPAPVFTANDACVGPITPTGPVDGTYHHTINANCHTYWYDRTWTATDGCGNTATRSQRIEVVDTVAPTFNNVPQNREVTCTWVDCDPDPTASDNCDHIAVPVTQLASDWTTGSCADDLTELQTWRAVDSCGNEAFAHRTIHYTDTVAPEWLTNGMTMEDHIGCDDELNPPYLIARDNCDGDPCVDCIYSGASTTVGLQNSNHVGSRGHATRGGQGSDDDDEDDDVNTFYGKWTQGSCPDEYSITYDYEVRDLCGNTNHATYVIYIEDKSPPTFTTLPQSGTVQCPYSPPTKFDAAATDDCDDDVTITVSHISKDVLCEDSYTVVSTFTATDNCGKSTPAVVTVVVQDTQQPTMTIPADNSVSCPISNDDKRLQPAIASDNCNPDQTITPVESIVPGTCPGNYQIKHTYTAADQCNAPIVLVRTITVSDTTAPELTCPTPESVSVSIENVPCPGEATATDLCDATLEVQFREVLVPGRCTDSYTLQRTWRVKDDCLNGDSCSQTITVDDIVKPVLVGTPDFRAITVEHPNLPLVPEVYATDNSGFVPDVVFTQFRTDGPSANEYTITRKWYAEDRCSNWEEFIQVITVTDNTPPKIICPPDLQVDCDSNPTEIATPHVLGEDFAVVYVGEEQVSQGKYVRTWTVTDDSTNKNTATCTQTITEVDSQPPCLSRQPANVDVPCDAVPPQAEVTASDNCDGVVHVSAWEDPAIQGNCPSRYQLVRHWKAVDSSGKVAEWTQVVTVTDNVKPVILNVPADATVSCENYVEAPELFAYDTCEPTVEDKMVQAVITHENVLCEDTFDEVRIWSVSDKCGNTREERQRYRVQDTKPPRDLTKDRCLCPPNDEWMSYTHATQLFHVIDNCDTSVNVVIATPAVTWTGAGGDAHYDAINDVIFVKAVKGVVYKVFGTATDNCDKVTPLEFLITVQDGENVKNCDHAPTDPWDDDDDTDGDLDPINSQCYDDANTPYTLDFESSAPSGGNTVVRYTVTVAAPPVGQESSIKDLSHWMLSVCPSLVIVSARFRAEGDTAWTNYPGRVKYVTDDKSINKLNEAVHVSGFKFDLGQPKGTTWEWEITFKGAVTMSPTGAVFAAKGGQTCYVSDQLQGPTC